MKYFQMAARAVWKNNLDAKIIDEIFFFTERHPYYVNQLCSRLYKLKTLKSSDVSDVWSQYATEERSQIANELDLLSQNQRKLLVALARSGGTNAPRSRGFQLLAKMPGSTIAQSLAFLGQNDYVYVDEAGNSKVIDPLIKFILADFFTL